MASFSLCAAIIVSLPFIYKPVVCWCEQRRGAPRWRHLACRGLPAHGNSTPASLAFLPKLPSKPSLSRGRSQEDEDDGGDDQREPGGARAAGARRRPPARRRRARPPRCLRYGAGHQGPGAPLLAGAAQRALRGVRLRRREARSHPVDIKVAPGSLANEESVNMQLNDKERVAAALENPNLRQLVDECLCSNDSHSH